MSNDLDNKVVEKQVVDVGIPQKRVNKSRRSFAAKGIIAPIVLSLANRPAWGASFRCTVSGFDSLATIGSGIALAEVAAMCDYMSVNDVFNNMAVDVDALVSTIFPTCANLIVPLDLTVGEALQGERSVDEMTTRLVAAHYNQPPLGTNPFGNTPVEDVFCHIAQNGAWTPFNFGGLILNGMEIYNFLGYVGIK